MAELPADLILSISSGLDIPTLSRLSRTNRRIHTILSPLLPRLPQVLLIVANYLIQYYHSSKPFAPAHWSDIVRDFFTSLSALSRTCHIIHTHITPRLTNILRTESGTVFPHLPVSICHFNPIARALIDAGVPLYDTPQCPRLPNTAMARMGMKLVMLLDRGWCPHGDLSIVPLPGG